MSLSTAANLQANSADARKARVMVVDDSVVIRGLVSRWLREEEDIEVVASHRHGLLAVNDVAKSRPDVVVLDIEMPEMDGIEALPQLLKNCPGVKVLMSSTLTTRNANISLKALQLGASDYIPKPDNNRGVTTSKEFRDELVAKVKALAGIDVSGVAGARAKELNTPKTSGQPVAERPVRLAPVLDEQGKILLKPFSRAIPKILAIGSSTGGPQALFEVFKNLSASLDRIPVVVTQHMPATFTTILSEHISRTANRDCHEAIDGEKLEPGKIYVAPGGFHLTLVDKGGPTVKLDDGPQVNFCKPAVDPMFDSVAKLFGASALGIILTGMGSDGAAGSVSISQAGGSIIAQDEETSVVWGMPGATARAGICSAVLPLNEITPKIIKIIQGC